MNNLFLIKRLLQLRREGRIHQVIPFDLNHENVLFFNLTDTNKSLCSIDILNRDEFFAWSGAQMEEHKTKIAIGLFNEHRNIYQRSDLFGGLEPRTVHLGIDLSAPAGTKVFSPLDGQIHSFKNNSAHGDFGPTIILEHRFGNTPLYTLFGHLTLDSLSGKQVGAIVNRGEAFAKIGSPPTNGDWPPHLHFQIITDMLEMQGDFPGVCSLSEREKYLEICLDPNLILGIRRLENNS